MAKMHTLFAEKIEQYKQSGHDPTSATSIVPSACHDPQSPANSRFKAICMIVEAGIPITTASESECQRQRDKAGIQRPPQQSMQESARSTATV